MSDLRRSGSYPIQTSDYTPHPYPPPDAIVEDNKGPFPASIRAVRDGKHANNEGRTVVICLDGTGDSFDNDNSNVVHFVSCLKKHEPAKQVTYYQSGIGTYGKGGLKNGIGAAMDMAVGSGLGVHIKDAYGFLMQNYHEGDRICLLGFSRGAYTVRCLAGMLHKVGLLPASNGSQLDFAYRFYKDDTPEGWKMSAEFKKTFCTDVNVYFVGVWDCVASVGAFIPRKLPFSKSPTNSIGYFRHAMALDERRAKFKVCQWQQQDPNNQGAGSAIPSNLQRRPTFDDTPSAKIHRGLKSCFGSKEKPKVMSPKEIPAAEKNAHRNHIHLNDMDSEKKSLEQHTYESSFDAIDAKNRKNPVCKTDALEVWFMGAHADIGGGAVPNESRHMLSRIPFRWMMRQCFECNTGIWFDTAGLAEQGLDVHTLWPIYQPAMIPSSIPPNSVLERYESKTLPPIQHRSSLLSIGDNEIVDTSDHHALLPECTEEHFDSLQPMNDQLVQAKGWWVLEVWPVKVRVLGPDGESWVKKVRCNLGRYRPIREQEPKMHWTVHRLVEEGKYICKGRVDNKAIWKVVA